MQLELILNESCVGYVAQIQLAGETIARIPFRDGKGLDIAREIVAVVNQHESLWDVAHAMVARPIKAFLLRHEQYAKERNFERCGCTDCAEFRASLGVNHLKSISPSFTPPAREEARTFPNPLQIGFGDGRIEVKLFSDASPPLAGSGWRKATEADVGREDAEFFDAYDADGNPVVAKYPSRCRLGVGNGCFFPEMYISDDTWLRGFGYKFARVPAAVAPKTKQEILCERLEAKVEEAETLRAKFARVPEAPAAKEPIHLVASRNDAKPLCNPALRDVLCNASRDKVTCPQCREFSVWRTPTDEDATKLDGAALIASERLRHVSSEGWTVEHDDGHSCGELALAAVCYAAQASGTKVYIQTSYDDGYSFVDPWPWDEDWDKRDARDVCEVDDDGLPTPEQLSSHNIRCLVKAGALIAAEIDRLQRCQIAAEGGGE